MESNIYDTIIVGAGAAGCSAAIYATRYAMKTLMLGGPMPGGLITEARDVENYPGFKSISGMDLAKNFIDQAVSLGAKYQIDTVSSISKVDNFFEVKTFEKVYQAKSVILATGTHHRKLGVKGEEEFAGRGVSYCATCDAPFFKDKVVAIIGGGNSAVEGAQDVAMHAKLVYLIYRSELKAAPLYIEELKKKENITEVPFTNIIEIKGDSVVKMIELDNPFNDSVALAVGGVFIQIGYVPQTDLAGTLGAELTKNMYVKVDAGMSSSIAGLFCAGDMNNASNLLHQQVTSAAEGAIAAQSAYRFIKTSPYLVKEA
ncbi:thioredoxin reductase [candidate division WWE3 bacterium CG_4_9_14_0_2_um_filter_35_11]|uniref:Thioredoxin reductase n=1 Tax=candidate division WWE3 bacterium CG_4_9_14_0_2_um_filter_35_11 TaxID=1975077 RepID=A0A2M8ELJ3_UNCKA|nr:MAG: thioredoxin reductase [candidate division WWE3 bacterium CG10_big_fil_rev_8_21_14_0_10_35_32]PJC23585.1 MAG: thioredoxin reductase [candidate division WWE3 bacterium CG_4_9_14_0_2_um_filter_35_11]